MGNFLRGCLCLFFCVAGLHISACAQLNSVNIVQPPYNGVCGGTPIQIPITTTGVYGADNVFTVQLIGGSATAPTYQDLPTKGNAPTLETTLPDTILPGAYRLRVVASNPRTTGIASNYFYPQRKPTARIVERPQTIAAYESVTIPIQLFGSDVTAYNSYRVTINDSLLLGGNVSSSFVAYPGAKTTTYRVTKVENACGEGTSFGQQTVVVEPFGLRLTTITPDVACPGSIIQVGFSANGTFDSGNRFTVQVTNEKGDYVDLPTKGDQSPLAITLPVSIPEGWGNYIRLVSTSPALVSSPIGGLYSNRALSVFPASLAILESDVKAIRFGEAATLVVQLTGHNVQCTLNDGTQLAYKPETYQPVPGRYVVTVKPSVSTTYTIKSATGGCGPVTTTGTVRVEVTNGIVAGKLADERPCIGQTIRVPIQTNAQFTAQTTFQIQIGGISLPAILQKDTVVATLTSQAIGVAPGLDGTYYVSSDIRVSTQNPAIVSTISPSRFAIGYVPVLANINVFTRQGDGLWDIGYPSTLNKPEPIRIMAESKSNLPITISVTDGSRKWQFPANQLPNSSDYPYAVFGDMPTQSTTYTLTEVSNKCGTRQFSEKTKQVVIKQSENRQVLVDNLPGRVFCSGESISIPFQTTGAVADSVRYRVTLYGYSIYGSNAFVPVVIGRSLKSPITVVLPDVEASTYSMRVEAENVALTSRDVFLTIYKKPAASILPGTTGIIAGESTTLTVGAKGGRPYTLLTDDGDTYPITAYDASLTNLDGTVNIPVKPDKTTTYRLKSITNVCGTTAISDERTITVVPYQLYITTPGNLYNYATTMLDQKSIVCRSGLLSVQYAIVGSAPADEVFDLQISKGNNTPFETIPLTSTGNPLVGRLPDSFTADPYGNYQVRIAGRKTGIVSQTSPGFRVFELPTATIGTKPGSSSIADPTVTIVVSVTNADFATTYGIRNYEPDYSGTYVDKLTDSNGTLYIMVPRQKTTYTLAFVRNGCGYGTVSGEATVSVRPTLTITAPTPGLQRLTCAGKPLAIAYTTTGDWSNGVNIVAELVSANNSSRELSRTTASQGTLSLMLPTDLLPGDYTVRLRSADAGLSASISLRIGAPVTALLTGNVVINTGQKITVKPVLSGTFPINYNLSNGSVGVWQTETATIELTPSQSGTYSLIAASNVCGAGSVGGSLTISVNPPNSKFITTDRVSGSLCGGDTVLVDYTAAGIGSASPTVRLSDRNGDQYAAIPTIGQASPLRAVLPAGLPAGINYRFRVTTSDPTVASSGLLSPVTILEKATGSILGPPYTTPGQTASLTLTVTGSPPVSVTLGQDGSFPLIWQETQPVTMVGLPASSLPATFRLLGVQNYCGPGLIQGTGIVRLELITAVEPTQLAIQVFPNPVNQTIFIENIPTVPLAIELWAADGRLVRRKTYPPTKAVSLPVADLPTGIYFLSVNINQKITTYRLLKH